jgi:hypothetical protein
MPMAVRSGTCASLTPLPCLQLLSFHVRLFCLQFLSFNRPVNPDRWPEMPDWCTYLSLECHLAHKVLGYRQHTDYQMAFSVADRMLVELAYARYSNLSHITELGTSAGVSSLYLGLMARTRSGIFQSFDWNKRWQAVPEVVTGWLDNMKWTEANILQGGGNPQV